MNKVISKVRVTEVDGLSDALVRLYKADDGISSDAFLKSVMDEIEKLSVSITTAINDKLIPYITAMKMANSAVYADFATKAEGEIKRVNEIVLRRGK